MASETIPGLYGLWYEIEHLTSYRYGPLRIMMSEANSRTVMIDINGKIFNMEDGSK